MKNNLHERQVSITVFHNLYLFVPHQSLALKPLVSFYHFSACIIATENSFYFTYYTKDSFTIPRETNFSSIVYHIIWTDTYLLMRIL